MKDIRLPLFFFISMIDLKDESEVPAINVVFPESAFKLFTYIQQHPFEKEGYYVPPLYDRDIEKGAECGFHRASFDRQGPGAGGERFGESQGKAALHAWLSVFCFGYGARL